MVILYVDIVNKINYHFKGPKDKYPYSMTASQEIGWDDCPLLNKPRFKFTKNDCDVTKYAADYVGLTGRSPYAKKGNENANNEKSK